MKTFAPSYYRDFHCLGGACRHTCCVGWEIDVDEESVRRFSADADTAPFLDTEDTPHIRLSDGERCPFLQNDGLCKLILTKGEDFLCDICRDHPRFRNFFSDRTEIGLGLVCEEAARLILSSEESLTLTCLSDDGETEELPEDERFLLDTRARLLSEVRERGMLGRLREYFLYRYLPDALYDDRLAERILLVDRLVAEVGDVLARTDGSLSAAVEAVRAWSYDAEYDDEAIERRLSALTEEISRG